MSKTPHPAPTASAADAAQAVIPLLFLMGPTAAGKSAVAMQLCSDYPFEIVSVDSALVYRGLDVGTAKPNPADRARVAHHLIDICDPESRYSAARFRSDADRVIRDIHGRGRVPLLVGGTGLYFRALEDGLAAMPDADAAVRERLQHELDAVGSATLHDRLRAVDPAAASRIHPNDPQRIVRALEVFELSGEPMSALWQREAGPVPRYHIRKIVLAPADRATLHRSIEVRFSDMLERGLINEVRQLRRRPGLSESLPAMRSVGYRQVWQYLDGAYAFAEMVERGVAATRQLAKRQLTWLRRELGCVWFDPLEARAMSEIRREIEQKMQLSTF